jgi:hypothetical protein
MAKPGEGLTEENYDEHVAAVPGIFGTTPTDALSGERDSVVSKNQEVAGQNIAAVDAAEEEGDEEAADVSDAEVARQTDAAAPSGAFAEEVDEAADEDESDDEDDKTAAEVISDIESAESAEEVDSLAEGDERVTVQRAADKRKEELSA